MKIENLITFRKIFYSDTKLLSKMIIEEINKYLNVQNFRTIKKNQCLKKLITEYKLSFVKMLEKKKCL